MSNKEDELRSRAGQNPEIPVPKRVIRVPNNFGLQSSMGTSLFGGSDVNHESKVLEIFKQAGYVALREGELDYTNSEELGFYLLSRRENPLFYSESRRLAQEAGAKLPKDFKYSEIIGSNEPIVAKRLGSDRGEGKYLLDSPEHKARFMAWTMIHPFWQIWELIKTPESYAEIKNIVRQIKTGNFSHNILNTEKAEDWSLEEFVTTPSEYYTSFRILADGRGKIHYATLLRTKERKNERKATRESRDITESIHTDISGNITHMTTSPGTYSGDLLEDPRSPFFIASKSIVSNYSMGSKKIRLNGQAVTDLDDRKVLLQHGIDPNSPSAPENLLSMASVIAKGVRFNYPYFGIDFILDENLEPYFMEANNGPMLDRNSLGLPENTSDDQCNLEMITRVAYSQ